MFASSHVATAGQRNPTKTRAEWSTLRRSIVLQKLGKSGKSLQRDQVEGAFDKFLIDL